MRQAIRTKGPRGAKVAQFATVPSPVGGWDALSPLATMPVNHAVQLDNFTPMPGWVELRKGSLPWAPGLGGPVQTLMPWNGPGTKKLFGVAGGKIYDVTLNNQVGGPVVTGLTNSIFNWVNIANSGGEFLIAANGVDAVQTFKGRINSGGHGAPERQIRLRQSNLTRFQWIALCPPALVNYPG